MSFMPAITTIPGLNIRKLTAPKQEEFISLTDLAQQQGDVSLIDNWLKNKNTIAYLAAWERLHNPDFCEDELKNIMMEAGLNRFRLSISRWTNDARGIGIIAKRGRTGGDTFAHIDIALEFAGWISAEFRLYVNTEFKRYKLKEQEEQAALQPWNFQRFLSKQAYHIQTDAVKECLIDETMERNQASRIYASEADVLNLAVFGISASTWRSQHPGVSGNLRDMASIEQLLVLSQLEPQNALLIKQGVPQAERLKYLKAEAQQLLAKQLGTVKKIK